MAATASVEYARGMKAAGLVRLLYAVDAVVAAVLALRWLAELRADPPDESGQQAAAYAVALGGTVPFAARRIAPQDRVRGARGLLRDRRAERRGGDGRGSSVRRLHGPRAGAASGRRCGGGDRLRADRDGLPELPGTTASTFFLDAITFAMVIALAELVRTRRAYDEIYAERAAQLERERATLAERAVNDERLRIARELHDVVAHAISVIAVQSSVGLERLRRTRTPRPGRWARSRRAAGARWRRCAGCWPSSGTTARAWRSSSRRRGWRTCRRWRGRRRRRGWRRGWSPRASAARRAVRRRSLRLPHRPGGADQRRQARTRASARSRCAGRPEWPAREVRDDGDGAAAGWTRGRGGAGHGLVGMRERLALFGGCSRPVRGATEAGGCARACRSRSPAGRRRTGGRAARRRPDDQRSRRRRRGAAAERAASVLDGPDDMTVVGEARTGRGRPVGREAGARCRAHGHPHAGDGRPRGHPADRRGPRS